jgi:hypothetical protein
MKTILLQEPELEFGTGRHVDIRFGLMGYGPVDFQDSPARRVRAGIVGTPESIEGVATWIARCREEIPCRESNHPYLFPKFPGCSAETNLGFSVDVSSTAIREVFEGEIDKALRSPNRADAIVKLAKLFLDEIEYLASTQKVQVIICAPPVRVFKYLNDETEGVAPAGESELSEEPDFHDWLKAHALKVAIPLQVVWPSTYDESVALGKSRRSGEKRRLQDEATRAWNFHCALYYKAGGVPWRMCRESTELKTLYVGVSFYKSLDKSRLLTSMAQVFNERGEGVIVKGGTPKLSKDDLQIHLDSEAASQLMDRALTQYLREHFHLPARVVLHKTSSFSPDEMAGFKAAINRHRIQVSDLLYLSHSEIRAFRDGVYPPLRGTFISLDDRTFLLYTRGSVEFFNVYPGMYVPHPLQFTSEFLSRSPQSAAAELLALTKMNWNNTQFDGLEPITVRAARQVGSILRYLDDPALPLQPRYSFYM